MKKHFHLVQNRTSPAVVAVVASNLAHIHNPDAHTSMTPAQLPNRVKQTGSETYHVFNNQITDNVNIYHSEARTLIPKACTMKYTKNIRAHTLTTHIQPQNPEIIYKHLPYCIQDTCYNKTLE